MAKFKVGDYVIGNELASKEYATTVKGWKGKVVGCIGEDLIIVRGDENYEWTVESACFDLYEAVIPSTTFSSCYYSRKVLVSPATLGISNIEIISGERNEYTTVNGKRDKATKVAVPTVSVIITLSDGRTGTATCDTSDFDIRTGVLTAIANIVFDGKFETVYEKYNKKQEKLAKEANRIERTCSVCGKTYNTSEEARACEKAHADRKKQKHENYLIRKEAKRRIAETEKEGRIKEVMAELLK